MMYLLALRNVLRNFRRLAAMMLTITVIFMLLIIGNAVLTTTRNSLYEVYAQSVSGDMTVGAAGAVEESNFTIFGSDRLLVGQYLIAPTLADASGLKKTLESYSEIAGTAGLVSSAARVEIGRQKEDLTVFGVDFGEYPQVVSGLKLVEGRFPEAGEPGIIIQAQKGEAQSGKEQGWKDASDLIGEKALLSASNGRNFTLREVPVTGVFAYPVDDSLLNALVIVDAETSRALNGYLYDAESEAALTEEDKSLLGADDFDDFFTAFDEDSGDELDKPNESVNIQKIEEADEAEEAEKSEEGAASLNSGELSVNPEALFSSSKSSNSENSSNSVDTGDIGDSGDTGRIADTGESADHGDAEAPEKREAAASDGSWNFMIISLHDRNDTDKVSKKLAADGFSEDNGYLVRDWSASVGGNAQLAWFLQLLYNAGLLFISIGAVIIAANALLLSVLERTGEIGTLRAMGAGRMRISFMIFLETLMVIFISALVGIILGRFVLAWLNASEIVIQNPYIQILFGGKPVRGEIKLQHIGNHLLAAFILTILSMLYPLKRALSIQPVEAMAE
ncbi:MAG: FtsX-like permease family protein [Spirochaetales bacterium]|nr:FtsX-like permease family protein [Spirochaetales bacterium]